jgi:hypothetical protein
MSVTEMNRGARKRWRIGATAVFVLAALAIGALVVIPQLGLSPLDDGPLPDPNGYVDLVKAGRSIVGESPGPKWDYNKASLDELRKWVDDNKTALAGAEEGLKHEIRVALPPSMAQLQTHMNDMGVVKNLCRLVGARTRLAELEQRWPDVVQSSLEVIDIAHRGSQGGVMIDALSGMACQWIGLSALIRQREALNGEQCRQVIAALEAVDKGREPTSKVVARDKAWARKSQSMFTELALALSPGAGRIMQASINSFDSSRQRSDTRLRLAIVTLALRRYHLERGNYPDSLSPLVPEYLAEVPLDPYSGQSIRYQLEPSKGYVLYSVGPDRVDDGGKPFPERSDWTKVRGDMLVDPQ